MVDTIGLAAFGILPKRNYSGRTAIHVSEIIYRGMIEIVQIIDAFLKCGQG